MALPFAAPEAPSPAGFSEPWVPLSARASERPGTYCEDASGRQLQEVVAAAAHRRRCAASRLLGHLTEDPADGDDERDAASGGGAQKYVLGGTLLPRESKDMLTDIHGMHLLTALQWSVAHHWHSNFGLMGPDAEEGEDPRVRGLISSAKPAVFLCELNALASFNMMDPILSYNVEFLMDVALQLLKGQRHGLGALGCVVQGAGPHFCPGGNHHPVNPPGATPLSMHMNTSSNAFIRLRESNLPSTTAMTGSVIGGGVALSLQQTRRAAAAQATMSFGNLSRGACPVMFLSQNLPATVGLNNAVDIYLTDSTYSACMGQRSGLVDFVQPNFTSTKGKALQMTRKMAATPTVWRVNHVRTILSYWQYQRESMGMTLAMRTGKTFANVKSARWFAPEEPSAEQAAVVATAQAAQRPKVAACAGCGAGEAAGGWGMDSLWYCGDCWRRWQEAPTDAGTDHTDGEASGPEGTVLGSGYSTCSDLWSDGEA